MGHHVETQVDMGMIPYYMFVAQRYRGTIILRSNPGTGPSYFQ